jgi:hypothetical protein
MLKKLTIVTILSLFIGLIGCATQVTEQPTVTKRASINLGDFKKIVLVTSEMPPKYANQGANIKAANKIDEILNARISGMFENVAVVKTDGLDVLSAKASQKGDMLIIKPYIKQVKFIGGAARFWAGAMAGSSVIIMDVSFEDAATGDIIGKTGTYRKAGAYTDVLGISSNRMLDDAAQDILMYISANQ